MKRYEILAPAGNFESLKSAVNNGADSVYLGLDSFNARMKADNFNLENIGQAVDFCHLYGVKVYVAINTSIKQDEFNSACKLIADVYNKNADGVILSDLALIAFAGCTLFNKPFEIVASTQLNIHDVDGVNFVKKLGATTVVLAREVNSSTVRKIAENCDIKIECFIHGALCVCQSGQCLFSSMVGGNSGNRGLCAQPCRQLYTCTDNDKTIKEGYLLSPKDWCGADVAQEMLDSGVSVYKIEGRNRRSQYAGGASKFYSQLFENNFEYTTQQLDDLKKLYNRGDYLTDGYYKGKNNDIIYPKVQGHIGVVVGVVNNGKLKAKRNINKGDAFKILRDGYECGSGIALESGNTVNLSLSGNVKNGDIVCITSDTEQLSTIDCQKRTIPVELSVTAKIGQNLTINARSADCCVKYVSEFICQKADKITTSDDEIKQQLSKTGETYYTITDIVVCKEQVFLPKSILNALRRNVLESLQTKIIAQYNALLNRQKIDSNCEIDKAIDNIFNVNTPKYDKISNSSDKLCAENVNLTNKDTNSIAVICNNIEQFSQAMQDNKVDIVVAKFEQINNSVFKQFDAVAIKRWYADVPSFVSGDYLEKCIAGCNNVALLAHNVSVIEFCHRKSLDYMCGSGLNIYNRYIAKVMTDNFKYPFVYSLELTLKEIQQINAGGYTFVDGELVLMKFVHCPYKLCYGISCNNCKFSNMTYIDKRGNKFIIKRRKADICTFELCNGVKLSANGKIVTGGKFLLDYNKEVLDYYNNLNNGKILDNRPNVTDGFTKGRLFDKVK